MIPSDKKSTSALKLDAYQQGFVKVIKALVSINDTPSLFGCMNFPIHQNQIYLTIPWPWAHQFTKSSNSLMSSASTSFFSLLCQLPYWF